MPSVTVESEKVGLSPDDKRLKQLNIVMKRNNYRQDALIEVLHKAQETFGFLEPAILDHVARSLKLPLSKVYGVATFYHLFSLKSQGKHSCVVCLGTACYVKGAGALLEKIAEDYHLHPGETTEDGQVSLLTARCIGACGIAPAAVYDGAVGGKQTPEMAIAKVKEWMAEGSG